MSTDRNPAPHRCRKCRCRIWAGSLCGTCAIAEVERLTDLAARHRRRESRLDKALRVALNAMRTARVIDEVTIVRAVDAAEAALRGRK